MSTPQAGTSLADVPAAHRPCAGRPSCASRAACPGVVLAGRADCGRRRPHVGIGGRTRCAESMAEPGRRNRMLRVPRAGGGSGGVRLLPVCSPAWVAAPGRRDRRLRVSHGWRWFWWAGGARLLPAWVAASGGRDRRPRAPRAWGWFWPAGPGTRSSGGRCSRAAPGRGESPRGPGSAGRSSGAAVAEPARTARGLTSQFVGQAVHRLWRARQVQDEQRDAEGVGAGAGLGGVAGQ